MKMDINKKNNDKEAKPFVAPGSTVPVSTYEIEKRKKRIKMAEEIGEYVTRVDGVDECENPYRVRAMCYIIRDEEVPKELKKQIKEFDRRHEKEIQQKQACRKGTHS